MRCFIPTICRIASEGPFTLQAQTVSCSHSLEICHTCDVCSVLWTYLFSFKRILRLSNRSYSESNMPILLSLKCTSRIVKESILRKRTNPSLNGNSGYSLSPTMYLYLCLLAPVFLRKQGNNFVNNRSVWGSPHEWIKAGLLIRLVEALSFWFCLS